MCELRAVIHWSSSNSDATISITLLHYAAKVSTGIAVPWHYSREHKHLPRKYGATILGFEAASVGSEFMVVGHVIQQITGHRLILMYMGF